MEIIRSMYFLILISGLVNINFTFAMDINQSKSELDLNIRFFNAAKSGDINTIQEILDSGFKDVNCKTDKGLTHLIIASQKMVKKKWLNY